MITHEQYEEKCAELEKVSAERDRYRYERNVLLAELGVEEPPAEGAVEIAIRNLEGLFANERALRNYKAVVDFMERIQGQVWCDGGRWTFFARVGGRNNLPIQPTRDTLLETLVAAMNEGVDAVPVWRGRR